MSGVNVSLAGAASPRCGLCVMRNGPDATLTAFCAPKGVRRRDDASCEFFHPTDELHRPLYGKAAPKLNVEDLF